MSAQIASSVPRIQLQEHLAEQTTNSMGRHYGVNATAALQVPHMTAQKSSMNSDTLSRNKQKADRHSTILSSSNGPHYGALFRHNPANSQIDIRLQNDIDTSTHDNFSYDKNIGGQYVLAVSDKESWPVTLKDSGQPVSHHHCCLSILPEAFQSSDHSANLMAATQKSDEMTRMLL